jgi:hypothetical protein
MSKVKNAHITKHNCGWNERKKRERGKKISNDMALFVFVKNKKSMREK